MSKLFVMAKVSILSHHTQQAVELLKTLAEDSERESGCLSYQILPSREENNTFITLEVWESAESEQQHWDMAHLKNTLGKLQPLLAEAPRIEKYSDALKSK
ncbi:putative quinol monooxygenase [uncultured Microbulbifer sp.]|uniref:putative quinol monooxygenase n=1 Tax=uncultured Microbulbifer sp. TaxID=348147 RepID=UPI00260D8556|nr:putative quinol monooxygenase [uncultured Microbulbifer sp.]